MFVHALGRKGKTVSENDLPANSAAFLAAIKPYRRDLVVGVECMFAWYWLADLCEREKIPFALGHALAMKHIHEGKVKSDKIDAGKSAALLRGGLFPLAYALADVVEDGHTTHSRRFPAPGNECRARRAAVWGRGCGRNHAYRDPRINGGPAG